MLQENKYPIPQSSKQVAIIVPLANRTEFTQEEGVSVRHLLHFLGKYDKYFVAPRSLKIHHEDFYNKYFSDRYFGSVAAHCRLMLSRVFYKTFREYKYVLIYHLDSLVFSDQMEQWCATDLDYIGPPWLNCEDSPWVRIPGVGNGGFSLRKVESFLKVLSSPAYCVDPDIYWINFCASRSRYQQYLNLPRKYIKRLKTFNGIRWQKAKWNPEKNGRNEDEFWSEEAVKYYKGFKIASFETGLRFAFEVAPRICYELNNRTLPFGCHAWHKYDRSFWEPYLLQ